MYPSVPRLSCRLVVSIIAAVCVSAFLESPGVGAENTNSAESLKSQADRWIELEKRAADERNNWRAQKEVLTTSIEVLRTEQAALKEKIAANDFAAERFRVQLDTAVGDLATHESAQAALTKNCETLEKRLRALFVRLPDPLKEKIGPFLEKLDKSSDGSPPSVSEKTRALVSALTAIDLFNNTLTLAHHLRPDGSGETLDVKVLYWGLTAGYGIDARGLHAWMLTPGASGWEWKEAPTHLAQIRTLISVYENPQPEIVTLPLASEGGAP